jgi:hypothetical protein
MKAKDRSMEEVFSLQGSFFSDRLSVRNGTFVLIVDRVLEFGVWRVSRRFWSVSRHYSSSCSTQILPTLFSRQLSPGQY